MADLAVPRPILLERMVPGGLCLGHMPDGRVALLRGGVPGDTVQFQIDSDKPSLVRGRVTKVLEPSHAREPSPCSHVERCGGCALLPLGRQHELLAKLSIVDQALSRTGRFGDELVREPIRTVSSRLGYRTRMRFQHRNGELGFFESQSKSLVVIDRCEVAAPELGVLLAETRKRMAGKGSTFDWVEGVELSVFPDNPASPESLRSRSGIVLFARDKARVSPQTGELASFAELGAVQVVETRAQVSSELGSNQQYWILPNLYLRIPLGGFSQVHPGVNRLLIECVLGAAREVCARTFYDLYGGAGNFTLPLLRAGLSGSLVEVNGRSVRLAEKAAEEQGLLHGTYRAEAVERAVQELVARGPLADVVILDPPRAGARSALAAAFRLARSRLILIGCDPTAFARDLRDLVDLGGQVRAVIPFDMFSGTHHIELVGILDVPERERG